MRLYEKYRPDTLSDVIGQPRAVETVQRLIDRDSIGGCCLWISGPSGTGKTTLARIIARTIADDLYITEYDSADSLSVSELDKIERDMQFRGFNSGKVYIINESHGLRKQTVRRLLGLLEKTPDYICWIFTTTKQGQEKLFDDNIDAGPLLSRCIRIPLTGQGLCKAFAEHAREIACKEGLNGKELQSYVRLVQAEHNNLRAVLQKIESGNMI